jgi:Cap4 SAVED domain
MTAEAIEPLPAGGSDPLPTPFLTVRVHDLTASPSLTAVCAGYEDGSWRAAGLARHLLDWVPDFALRPNERNSINSGTAQEQIRRAVRAVFGDGSIDRRGEPAEILLHIICRQVFHSETVINKVFFKTAGNDVVKGFDGIHIVHGPAGLELWLGEAKFYKNREAAIRDAITSLQTHFKTDYLRGEFALVTDKIDSSWRHAREVQQLIHENAPIQDVFTRVTVPVLLAYDSPAVRSHTQVTAQFISDFESEMREGLRRFATNCDGSLPVKVRLFLAPLASKRQVVAELERRLPAWR